jgi:MFS transporter, DHA1 family, inner membrane transport protein
MSKQQKIIILLLAAINFTHILDFMIIMPLSNYLMPHFNITPKQFSYIVSSYSISAFFSGLMAMFFVDRFDRKKIVLFAYIGFLIGTFCCGIAPTHQLLLCARIIAGLFGGVMGSQVISIVADTFSYEIRGRAMGILFASFSVASVIGIPLSLFLASNISWHIPFFFIAGLGIIIIPFVVKFLPSVNSHLTAVKESPIKIIQNILGNKINIIAFASSGILMLGHFVIIPFLNPFMQYNVGFTDNQRNLIYIIGGLVTMVSAPNVGKLADKYGKHKVFTIFAIASLLPILAITNLHQMPYYYVLMITGIWFILSSGRNIPAQAIVSNVVPAHQRGSFQSFNSCISSAFVGLATLIAGNIVTKSANGKIENYHIVGYISIVAVLVALVLVHLIPKINTTKN